MSFGPEQPDDKLKIEWLGPAGQFSRYYKWVPDDETDHGPDPGPYYRPKGPDTSPPDVLTPIERPDWQLKPPNPNRLLATESDPDWGNQRSGGGGGGNLRELLNLFGGGRPVKSKSKRSRGGVKGQRKKQRSKKSSSGLRLGMKKL